MRLVRRFMPMIARLPRASTSSPSRTGRALATPLLLVLVLVEVTDLIFAVDSIPAIFGVTQDPFIVFTSNIFAILGLRSLYFLLAAVVDQVLPAQVRPRRDPDVRRREDARRDAASTSTSCCRSAIILGVLALSIVASLIWPRRHDSRAGDKKPVAASTPGKPCYARP